MWVVSPAAQSWYEAMADQDLHEIFDCPPCRASETPVCAEGVRLQKAARDAHEALISDQYAGRAVA